MESENVKVNSVPDNIDLNLVKQGGSSTHALGLQDLYKAAFTQEAVNDFSNNTAIVSTNLIGEPDIKLSEPGIKYLNDHHQKVDELDKSDALYKDHSFDEPYQLYSLRGLEYSVDFIKPESSLDLNPLNFEESKNGSGEVLTNTFLTRRYESFRSDSNSVLDLDKGIQIQLVKADGTSIESDSPTTSALPSLAFNYCEYSGDPQILQRYLCDSGSVLCDSSNITTVAPIETDSINFTNKKSNNTPEKSFYDSDGIGVNPETLGVRFEDCDFNSSDSFASTESIIPKNIKCPKCPKKFMFKSDLLRHDKYKHSVKPKLFCKYCNKEFISQQNLLFHEKSHKKKRCSYKCEICKKVFKKSAILVKHTLKKHSKVVSFTCDKCSKVFTSQILLNGHIRKCHLSNNEKPFKCEICSKSFEKKQGLSCHAKAHLDEHLYTCQYCNKSFSKVCYLKNHLKSHQEEKDIFVCDTCGKDFKSSHALEEHVKKHSGGKPFTCNVCMKSFAYKAYFKVHIKKHGEVKPYQCSLCQKAFTLLSDLNKHEKNVHQTNNKSLAIVNCNDIIEYNELNCKKENYNGNTLSQEVCTQTIDFSDTGNLQNLTLQNVNLIVDQFGSQQPILLTSLGSLINTNSVPVILTQNPSGPYSVSSIT